MELLSDSLEEIVCIKNRIPEDLEEQINKEMNQLVNEAKSDYRISSLDPSPSSLKNLISHYYVIPLVLKFDGKYDQEIISKYVYESVPQIYVKLQRIIETYKKEIG